MSLQDPNKKMSKSDKNLNNIIALLDEPKVIIKKINRSVTDSGSEIIYDEKNKPGIANLFNIYKTVTDNSIKEIEHKYIGKMYSSLSKALITAEEIAS